MDTRGGTCNSASMIQVPDFIIITINFFFRGGCGTCLDRTSGWFDRAVTQDTDELIVYLGGICR